MRRTSMFARHLVWACAVAMLVSSAAAVAQEEVAKKLTPKKRADIYDPSADAKQQIADAVAIAKRDNKRVILQFGANWCGWCHLLHGTFKSDEAIAKVLQYEFEVVLVDVDKKNNADIVAEYGIPASFGLPSVALLELNGRLLTAQSTVMWEKGSAHDPATILATLKSWTRRPLVAEEVLSTTLAKAAEENKKVFVHFSAPWCGWCKRLDAYLATPEIAKVFNSAFIPVKIDQDRMIGGMDMHTKIRGEGGSMGIPFFMILDASGKQLADSNGPDNDGKVRNVGAPAADWEIAHFMDIMKKTHPKFTDKQLSVLKKGFEDGK